MIIVRAIGYIFRELLILLIILNPIPVTKLLGDIVKVWGYETAAWNRFMEIRYFFGDPEATLELSNLKTVKGEHEIANIYLLEAAYKGNSLAQMRIFHKHADEGNMLADKMAIALLSRLYYEPKIYLAERMLIRRDYTYAYELFSMAHSQGASEACGYLGFFHYTGVLGIKDVEKANDYWFEGCLHHDPLSEYFLAVNKLESANDMNSSNYQEGFRTLFCATTHKFGPAQAFFSEIIKEACKTNNKALLIHISNVFKDKFSEDDKHSNDLYEFYSNIN